MFKQVTMQNPFTRETETVPVGWNWRLFFLSPFFGIPLFKRGLTYWGMLFLALNGLAILGRFQADASGWSSLSVLSNLLALGFMVFIGLKGNELTARNYLSRGWTFVDPWLELTLERLKIKAKRARYVGRPASASTAAGTAKIVRKSSK